MQNQNFDVIIIGAGIIGAMTARFLSQYSLSVLVVDKEWDVGMGASSANSAILHAGYDPKPGSMKARMNTRGNLLWDEVGGELAVPMKRTGSYVVAIGEEQYPLLDELYRRGIENGIPGLKILNRGEFLNREPLINPRVSGALWTPSAGVIDPFTATLAAMENAITNGVRLALKTKVESFIKDSNRIVGIRTNLGDFTARWVVNAAGIFSDTVIQMAGIRPEFKITPRRGEYLIFDASKVSINNVLFPLPNAKGKGTLVTTTVHGNVMVGPNATILEDKEESHTTMEGLDEVFQNALHLIPSLSPRDVIAQYAGIRATGNFDHDFLIEASKDAPGLINLAGIESPGFVSAPAIAEYVVELMKESGEKLTEKPEFNPIRKAKRSFHQLSHKERGELVAKNPAYGRIVCRCEEVTEGEIVDAIRESVPALTYDALKRRTWLGTGRCQGGFDYPRVIEILAKELGVSEMEITKRGPGSEFLVRRTKDLI